MEKTVNDVIIKVVEYDSNEYTKIVQLRYDVLRAPLGLQFSEDFLARDANNILIAAFAGDEVIGCCQLDEQANGIYQLRQMAVSNKFHNTGIGTRIIRFAESFVRERGGKRIELHAREVAIGFYQKLDYLVVGDRFMEIGLPHFEMVKNLA